jgi:RNA polymerase sigma-70 factor, ECF subfamily
MTITSVGMGGTDGLSLMAMTLLQDTGDDGQAEPLANPSTATGQSGLDRFEGLFRDFEQQIFGYVWRIIGDEQAARDILQETFIRAWQKFERISSYDRPDAWLYRVATNLALNYVRDRKVTINPDSIEVESALVERDPGSLLALRDLIKITLLAMTPRMRAALVLREVYGLSCDEIGQVLGISRDATKATLWRARSKFREYYQAALSQNQPGVDALQATDRMPFADMDEEEAK